MFSTGKSAPPGSEPVSSEKMGRGVEESKDGHDDQGDINLSPTDLTGDFEKGIDEAILQEEERLKAFMIQNEANAKLTKIRQMQSDQAMEHVCVNLLGVGSYLKPGDDSEFVTFLKKEAIRDVYTLTKLSPTDYESMGYRLPNMLGRRLFALGTHYGLNVHKAPNPYLMVMGTSVEELQAIEENVQSEIMDERLKDPNFKEKSLNDLRDMFMEQDDEDDEYDDEGYVEFLNEIDEVVEPAIVAGPNSKRASLASARKKVSFVENMVTQRTKARTAHGAKGTGAYTPKRPGSNPTMTPRKTPGGGGKGNGGGRTPPVPTPTPPIPPSGNGNGTPPGAPGGGGGPPGGSGTAPAGTGGNPTPQVVYMTYPPSSAAVNFDKGGRRSASDYEKFSSKEQWSKWQRSTIGTAYEHKCENVLNATYVPDPSDPDEVELFASQKRFMYSVFTKVLVESKATEILREYSNMDKPNFGDAQAIYADLCDYFEGGAQARVSAATLETQLTTLRLNKDWTKSVTSFVNKVAHLIRDHKEATSDVHDDVYYIEKLNTTFSEHRDMAAQIQTLETQDAMLTRRLGTQVQPRTYEAQLFELSEFATVLDNQYKTRQAKKRNVNTTTKNNGGKNGNQNSTNGKNNNQKNDRSGKNNGSYNNNSRNGGSNNARNRQPPGPGYIPPQEWYEMSQEQQQRVISERNRARSRSAHSTDANASSNNNNNATNNGGSQNGGTSNNATNNYRANETNQQANRPNAGSQTQAQPGTMFRNMVANASNRATNASQQTDTVTINGTTYRRANVSYRISNHGGQNTRGGLVDGGANGGVLGDDVRVLEHVENSTVDLTGLNDSNVGGLKIGLGAGIVETATDGPIILLMAQYADLGKGQTIHSKGQMQHFGAIVDDTSRQAGGRQCIITQEGYVLPIHIRDGLPRIDMRPPTDKELEKYPHVFITSDSAWDPTVLDNEYDEVFYDAIMEDPEVSQRREQRDPRIDDHGFLRSREDYEVLFKAQDAFISANMPGGATFDKKDQYYDAHATAVQILDSNGDYIPDVEPSRLERAANMLLSINPNRLRRHFPHLDALKPYFGWVSNDRIKSMIEKTTQHYRQVVNYPFRKHFKSRFPAANVHRRNEWVATDTFFSDTPAADDGIPGHANSTMMQMYVGLTSGHVSGYPMTSEKQIPETLEDNIRKVGAPVGLMSDQAKAELHGRTKELLRMYEIDDRQSEAEYQHQNPAERKIQDVKRTMNSVMDRTGCPKRWWLLAALYTICIMNVLPNVNGEIPESVVKNEKTDISKFMHYHFWQEVFVESHKKGQKEELARWCYPADNVGDELTWWVLLNDTETLVTRSNVRPARDPLYPNLLQRPQTDDLREPKKEAATSGEPQTSEFTTVPTKGPIYNMQDQFDVPVHLPRYSPEDLLGLTYLHELPDGQTVRAKIVKKIHDNDAENHERIKMLVAYDDDKIEELMSYNELSDIVSEQHDRESTGEQEIFSFREISDHVGPIKRSDPEYKGSSYNVLVEWEDGTKTWEPVSLMIASDPATLAAYAKEHDLLDTPGWKNLNRIARRAHVLQRMINASKRAQRFNAITYKFGVRIPRNVKEAIRLDVENGNTYWQDAMKKELGQLDEYNCFHSLGKDARVPKGYQQIPLRMVFDIKQDLTRKARMVARGDKTNPPADSVYSGVASLRSLRIVCFLAELNGLTLTGGDVGNAYLEAYTKEKVCFRAGPEFGSREGELMIIDKALYGLRTSGARFHAKFADTLRKLGFTPTYADPDVWIRDAGDRYEYVVVYVDDVLTALKNPKEFYDALKSEPWNYKLKNVEEPKYHLGGDFFRDKDGTFCYGAQTYIKRMMDNYKLMFGELPKEYHSPMEKGDQPEMDDSELLGPEGIQQYQSLIGAVQWTISLCRFDVAHAIMSLGRFRAAPRVGHLERLKRVIGYLRKRSHGCIRFRSGQPNHEDFFGNERVHYDWSETVYDCVPEQVDQDAPVPKGKVVRTSSFCDANLMHDMVTGRSASGILEMLNQTPIDWFSKRQNQVETATYGSEFMVARQAVERIQDLRYTLRSFGVPLEKEAWLFGDNRSVMTSSTIPHSTLSKRWNALSYHKVREAVASGWLRFEHMPGTENPADVFTKPLPWHTMKNFIEPLLMWKGDLDEIDGANQSPKGSRNPEGSDADPGRDSTRDSEQDWIEVGNVNGSMTYADEIRQTAEMPAGVGGFNTNVVLGNGLSNNQYYALMDYDGNGNEDTIELVEGQVDCFEVG